MLVQPARLSTQGAALFAIGMLALGACDDPTARTDLRPEGPPEVLAVLVMNDPFGLYETATYCKVGDEKRPSLVGTPDFNALQICDTDLNNPAGYREDNPDTPEVEDTFVAAGVEDAAPTFWYSRIMFDELLDPDVEELVEITDADGNGTGQFAGTLANTRPVTLTCGGAEVPYDGYYSPSGNNVTWPLGPSLFIAPLDPSVIPAGSTCEITLRPEVVKDKQGVSTADTGPFSFGLQALAFLGFDAEDEGTLTADAPLLGLFNGFVDPASLTAAEVEILEVADCAATMGTVRAAAITGDDTGTGVLISLAAPPMDLAWVVDTTYRVTFAAGAEVTDLAGATLNVEGETICFTTEAP